MEVDGEIVSGTVRLTHEQQIAIIRAIREAELEWKSALTPMQRAVLLGKIREKLEE